MHHLRQIWYIALNGFERRYAGLKLGLVWVVVQPLILFSVFYLVTTRGLKLDTGGDQAPFYAVLFCGLVPWMTASGTVAQSANLLFAQRHLIQSQTVAPVFLPFSLVVEKVLIQFVLLAIVVGILAANDVLAGWSVVAVAYFTVCLAALALAAALIVSLAGASGSDVSEAVGSLTIVWFWGTPIVWSPAIMPEGIRQWLALNPLYYVVEGYRGALLYGDPFAGGITGALVFWGTVLVLVCIGIMIYRIADMWLREWIN